MFWLAWFLPCRASNTSVFGASWHLLFLRWWLVGWMGCSFGSPLTLCLGFGGWAGWFFGVGLVPVRVRSPLTRGGEAPVRGWVPPLQGAVRPGLRREKYRDGLWLANYSVFCLFALLFLSLSCVLCCKLQHATALGKIFPRSSGARWPLLSYIDATFGLQISSRSRSGSSSRNRSGSSSRSYYCYHSYSH